VLEALRLVRGAVSTKDLVPVLTHFALHDGRLQGFNGRIQMGIPVPELKGLSLTVPGKEFLRAVDGCGESDPVLSVSDSFLMVKAGAFSARLPTAPIEAFPLYDPSAERPTPWRGGLQPLLAGLHPFIGIDASRPWAGGISLGGKLAAATNNVIIALAALPRPWRGDCILPLAAVEELLRIALEPKALHIGDNAITFHFAGGLFLRSTLIDGTWPTSPLELVQQLSQGAVWEEIPQELAQAVEQVAPFCHDFKSPAVILEAGRVRTPEGTMSAERGGFKGSGMMGTYRVEPLKTVLAVATHADWSRFPRVPWKGNGLEGVLVGIAQ
jgi:hypothetical protein